MSRFKRRRRATVRAPDPLGDRLDHARRGGRPSDTTIDWQAFFYDEDGVRGISLRAMVGAGLYARMDHAVRALRASGLGFCTVRCENPSGTGRPIEDHIMTLQEAQFFAGLL